MFQPSNSGKSVESIQSIKFSHRHVWSFFGPWIPMATTHPPWWTGGLRRWKFAGWSSHDEQQVCPQVWPRNSKDFRKMIPKFAICYVKVYHCIMAYPISLDLWTTTSNSHGWAHGRFPEFHRVPMRARLGSRKGHHQILEGPMAIHGLPPVCRFFWNPVSVPGMFPVAGVFCGGSHGITRICLKNLLEMVENLIFYQQEKLLGMWWMFAFQDSCPTHGMDPKRFSKL